MNTDKPSPTDLIDAAAAAFITAKPALLAWQRALIEGLVAASDAGRDLHVDFAGPKRRHADITMVGIDHAKPPSLQGYDHPFIIIDDIVTQNAKWYDTDVDMGMFTKQMTTTHGTVTGRLPAEAPPIANPPTKDEPMRARIGHFGGMGSLVALAAAGLATQPGSGRVMVIDGSRSPVPSPKQIMGVPETNRAESRTNRSATTRKAKKYKLKGLRP